MDAAPNQENSGPFEARYLAFLETITHLRPSLHRYCARMIGSVLDGEDLVQETLFHAYRRLDTFDSTRPLSPWLFRIAHNRCIDFLRRRGVREEAEQEVATPIAVAPDEPLGPAVGHAVEHLVLALPPLERACVLLKDVFDYSLDEAAELVGSTIGGVKAALSRGRSKLAALRGPLSPPPRTLTPAQVSLLHEYVQRFNHRDWEGIRALIAEDARLRVADRFAGPLAGSPYFSRYDQAPVSWRLAAGEVDGEAVILRLRPAPDGWTPFGIIRLELSDGRVAAISDYSHCSWMTASANVSQLL